MMKMRRFEKRFVNSSRHSERVAVEAEHRLRELRPTPGARLLDVGCGNGAVAIRAATTLGLEAVGVDVDPEQIASARSAAAALPHLRFLVADARTLPFNDGEFDLVYTNKTTHHIRDWPAALAEMARVLAPGGTLLYSDFTAPAGRRLPNRHAVDAALAAQGLRSTHARGGLFHYRAVFEKAQSTPKQ